MIITVSWWRWRRLPISWQSRQPQLLQQLPGRLQPQALGVPMPRAVEQARPGAAAGAALQGHQQVLQHREAIKQAQVLEGAGQAQAVEPMGRLAGDGGTAPEHRAAARRRHAGDQVEQSSPDPRPAGRRSGG
jgi:hypothetical protein